MYDHETLPFSGPLSHLLIYSRGRNAGSRLLSSDSGVFLLLQLFPPPHGCAGCIVFARASLLEDIVWAVTEPPVPANILHAAPTAGGDGAPPAGRRGAARHSAPHGSETQLECYGTLLHVTQADLADALLKVNCGVTVRLASYVRTPHYGLVGGRSYIIAGARPC